MQYSRRVVDAFALMFELHGEQTRKGSETPYIGHLMATAATVAHYGGDEDQFIAALLHDAVEDQGGRATLERIRRDFGGRVAALVLGCSDSDSQPKPPWRERKEQYVAAAAADAPEQKLLIAADKLHNAQSIVADLRSHGAAVWRRFTGGREGSLWYYGAMVRALSNDWDHPLLQELAETVDVLQRMAQAPPDEACPTSRLQP